MSKIDHGIDSQQLYQLINASTLTQTDLDEINANISSSRVFTDNHTVKATLDIEFATQHVCIFDYLNFTFSSTSFPSPTWFVRDLDHYLKTIFGYGITQQRDNGAYMYERSYMLGQKYGLMCEGGQNGSILVSINGTGLLHAMEDWHIRLYQFLNDLDMSKITRIDLAHDDYTGTRFNIDSLVQAYNDGFFNNGNRKPSVKQFGDWLTNDGTGRTFAVGKRENGLYFRGYEKGAQLKSLEYPEWFRCEVELKSTNRILPLDILANPHMYFAGSFPLFNDLSHQVTRIETYKNEINSDLEHRIRWGRRQLGGLIKLMLMRGYTPAGVVAELGKDTLPPKFLEKFVSDSSTDIRDYLDNHFFNQSQIIGTGV